uniref:Uncharacterized protein n=1 Tax=Knipowitschia caucasica TaxID=637954 RepID=A0AAV2JCF2_KNICA
MSADCLPARATLQLKLESSTPGRPPHRPAACRTPQPPYKSWYSPADAPDASTPPQGQPTCHPRHPPRATHPAAPPHHLGPPTPPPLYAA